MERLGPKVSPGMRTEALITSLWLGWERWVSWQAHPLCPHPNILSGSAGLAGASDGQELKRASRFLLPACTFPSCPQGTDP